MSTLSKEARYDALLGRLPGLLASAATETAVYTTVVESLHPFPAYDWTGIYILESPETLVLGPYLGAPTDHVRIPVGRGICGQSAQTGEAVLVEDVTESDNYLACSIETRSEIVVPIRVRGAYHAQIDVDSHTVAAFDAVDRDRLLRIAGLMGARIEALTA